MTVSGRSIFLWGSAYSTGAAHISPGLAFAVQFAIWHVIDYIMNLPNHFHRLQEKTMRRIITDAQICHGKAHVEGTRIPVHIFLDLLAVGETYENILQAYPQLNEKDIQACLNYAAKLATEEVVYEYRVA